MCVVDATQAKGKAGVSNWYKKEQRKYRFCTYLLDRSETKEYNVCLEGSNPVAFFLDTKIFDWNLEALITKARN